MPLYIKDDQVAELARDLARRKHTTVTDVVRQALEREAKALAGEREAVWRDIQEMQAVIRAESKEPFTSNHDFLYNEQGDPIL
jgi:hypothetical protein